MNWGEWVDFGTLKTVSFHTSGIVGSLLSFMLIAYLIGLAIPEGPVRTILEWIEGFSVIGLVGWLVFQTGYLLWIRRVKNGLGLCVLVA